MGPLGGIRIRWGQEYGALKVESVFSKEAMPESLYPVSLTSPTLPSGGHSEKQLPASQEENLTRTLPCRHPDLRIAACRTVRKQLSVG